MGVSDWNVPGDSGISASMLTIRFLEAMGITAYMVYPPVTCLVSATCSVASVAPYLFATKDAT